ncbi:hypothetical protein ScPMuIL_014060 [Solemya velum]
MKRRRFFRYGMPFLVLVVGGSFGLKEFTSVRYQFRKSKLVTPADAEKYGLNMKSKEEKPSLEDILETMNEKPLDSWENIRGPRPWEDSKQIQDMQRKAAAS